MRNKVLAALSILTLSNDLFCSFKCDIAPEVIASMVCSWPVFIFRDREITDSAQPDIQLYLMTVVILTVSPGFPRWENSQFVLFFDFIRAGYCAAGGVLNLTPPGFK